MSRDQKMKEETVVIVITLRQVAKIFLIILLSTIALSLIFLPEAKPDSQLYGIKRMEENIFLKFQLGPEAKVNFYNNLLQERLREMQYLVNRGRVDLLWSASLRYSTTAGLITDLLLANNLSTQKKYFLQEIDQHQAKLAESLHIYQTKYPGQTIPGEHWKYIEDGINYLTLYKQKLTN